MLASGPGHSSARTRPLLVATSGLAGGDTAGLAALAAAARRRDPRGVRVRMR